MITIYGSDGMAKTQVPCDDNSTQEMELQGDNALSLSFTLYEHVALEVNDYAEFMGRKYWLMERYHPEQVSTVEWKYDIKLYGIESLVKRFLVINDTDGLPPDRPAEGPCRPDREKYKQRHGYRRLEGGHGGGRRQHRHRLFRKILRRGAQRGGREGRTPLRMVGRGADRQYLPLRAGRGGRK